MRIRTLPQQGFLLVEVLIMLLLVSLVACACLEGVVASQKLNQQTSKQRYTLELVRQQQGFLQSQPSSFWRGQVLPAHFNWQGNVLELPSELSITSEATVYKEGALLQLTTSATWQDATLSSLTITTLIPF